MAHVQRAKIEKIEKMAIKKIGKSNEIEIMVSVRFFNQDTESTNWGVLDRWLFTPGPTTLLEGNLPVPQLAQQSVTEYSQGCTVQETLIAVGVLGFNDTNTIQLDT